MADPARRVPRIVLTPGEPAGIGPDLAVALAQRALPAQMIAVADPQLLAARAARLQLPLAISPWRPDSDAVPNAPGSIQVVAVAQAKESHCGELDPANAAYVLQTLRVATQLCMDGKADALVTGPVQKSVINDAGFPFTGHTEFLAELTQTPTVVMMLMTSGLRVALVTTHLPLREVSAHITATHLETVLRIIERDLRAQLGIAAPRILVCGLNPHAGEGGHLGTEDRDIVEPVLSKLRAEGYRLDGPVPADTAFIPKRLADVDVVLAMYHDQGLPVLKYAGFGAAINMTLGLPFIRTSVDHGTALELAGTGRAEVGSLQAAIDVAIEAAEHRRHAATSRT